MENTLNIFKKEDIRRPFNTTDIGKVFWRVDYQGRLTQLLIHEIKEENKAVFRLANLTRLIDYEYKLNDVVDYMASSTYGTDVIFKSDQYYFDLEEAKKASFERFEKEVNPNGKYRVARYFDDIFEGYASEIMTKKEAKIECDRKNDSQRHYVQFRIKAV